ncbi:IS3 family transposase [Bacillus sp. J33]
MPFGSRSITAVLNDNGILINRKAVQRHMKEINCRHITGSKS